MTPQRVARSYYLIAGLYTLSASVIWGVNTLFLLDAGLDIFEVFIANAAFLAGMVVFEIPTGVVADTLGRRISFLASVVVLMVSTLLYVGLAQVEGGVVAYSVVSVFMGLGFTFYSGAVEAWLVDALHSTGFDGQLDSIFARGQMISGAAMLVGTVGGGLLGQIDLAIPFLVRAGLLAALFVLATARMHDVGFSPRRPAARAYPAEMRRVARSSIEFGWNQREIRLLMVAAFVQGTFFMWAFYAWQPYFLELLDDDAVWVAGIVSALISLSTMAGNAIVEYASRLCTRRTTLLLWAAGVQTAAAVVVGLTTSFWVAVPVFLLITGAMGVRMPVRQSYIHHIVPTEQRATVVSFDSMVSGVGGVGGQAGLGALSQSASISAGFVVGGLGTVLILPVLTLLRRLDGAADRLVPGEEAGSDGTAAACGLPAVSTVESRDREELGVE